MHKHKHSLKERLTVIIM